MDVFGLSRKWFDWSFENPEKIKPIHSAIFFFSVEHCNRLGWKDKFGFPTSMVMEAIGVKKWKTYKDAFDELVDWGFIIEIEKSKNQYSSCIISIGSAYDQKDKAQVKALDKALSKHGQSHRQKQGQSTVGIDIQETRNKKQETIVVNSVVTDAPKVATLQSYIKNEFTLEFIQDIYKQYPIEKEEFQEECNNFALYWTERSPNGTKERWQKEKTFDPKLRFRKWMSNNKKWNKQNLYSKPNGIGYLD